MDAALAEEYLPQTISTSYGEEEQTGTWSPDELTVNVDVLDPQ